MTDTEDWDDLYWQAMLRQAQWEDQQRQVRERRRGMLIAFGSILAGTLLLILLAVSARSAHAVYGTPQERAVCLPEFKRLCPSLTDDSLPEMLLLCVRVNRSRFSPACSAVLEQRGLYQ